MERSRSRCSPSIVAGCVTLALGRLFGASVVYAQSHPLDALTAAEIQSTVQVLRSAGRIDNASRLPIIRLQEPAKDFVLAWNPGDPVPRRSFSVVKQGPRTFEAIVDLDQEQVVSFSEILGVQPPILGEELGLAQGIALADPRFQAALLARGISSFDTLLCAPLSAGYFAVPEEEGKRLLRVTCFQYEGTNNPFGRPIENLTAVVELNARRVLAVVDSGIAPLPSGEGGNYPPPPTRPTPRPLLVVQPAGHDFVLTGNQVSSDPWEFHFRVEPREGLVISRAVYNENGHRRDVLYRGSLGELFVPYADSTSNWYYRTFMDEGEYGVGKATAPLDAQDCPANAVFLAATLADDLGNPYMVPDAVCVFERTPHLLWKRFDIFTGTSEGRAGREVVVRYAAAVGNYDYFFEWIFGQNGSISMNVGAGGIMEMKAVTSTHRSDPSAEQDTRFGTLVDENLVASYHQHIFNVRLDLDVDGRTNAFHAFAPQVKAAPEASLRKSTWVFEETAFDHEGDVASFLERQRGADTEWVVSNPGKHNRWGYPVAYRVHAEGHADLLMSENDFPAPRAAFAAQELWATPFRPDEMYSAGDYPNQNPGNDGLAVWTQANRDLRSRDLVLWVNTGLTHRTRAEDWPVMPTEWFGGFTLEPVNFFDRNPAIDLPKEP